MLTSRDVLRHAPVMRKHLSGQEMFRSAKLTAAFLFFPLIFAALRALPKECHYDERALLVCVEKCAEVVKLVEHLEEHCVKRLIEHCVKRLIEHIAGGEEEY